MAGVKSKVDVFRNEKYMNDAVSSALLNLHKAARKKREYVWSTERFASLDSIWGDLNESKTSKTVDDVSNANKDSSPGLKSSLYGGTDSKQSFNQLGKSKQAKIEIQPKIARDIGEQGQRIFKNRTPALLENFTETTEEKKDGNASNISNILGEHKMPNVETFKLRSYSQTSSATKLDESKVTRDNQKRNADVDCKIAHSNNENFQMKRSVRDPIKTKDLVRNPFDNAVQTSNVEKNKDVKLSKDKKEIQGPRKTINRLEMHQKEKTAQSTPRKIQSSSVNSLLPVQKPTESQKQNTVHSSDRRIDLLNSMLLLKIFKGNKLFDFTLEMTDFKRVIKRFPNLQTILPEIDGEEKEMDYSADAVKIVFRYLLNHQYSETDERTAVEVLAASKSWEITQLHAAFQHKFLKELNENNMHLAYGAAVHYGLNQICDAYKCAFSDSDLSTANKLYRQRKCNISVSTYIEPREICIPSNAATATLQDNFDRDIKNEIAFKAIAGSYVITGFHILLNLDNEKDIDSTTFEFFYVVRNPQNFHEEEMKVKKPPRPNIIINLRKNLEVNQDETAEIVVETSIKPYLCSAIQEGDVTRTCDEGQFCLTMSSNYKMANSNEKRFFIAKLLYHPKT